MSTALKFVDCSSNNPLPNIAAYKAAGHQHLAVKVSEGIGYTWFDGATVARAAHAAGLHVGHYHWLREDSDPAAQARFWVDALVPRIGKLPTVDVTQYIPDGDWGMVDFEQTYVNGKPIQIGDRQRAKQLRVFVRTARRELARHGVTGFPIFCYAPDWYLGQLGRRSQRAARKLPNVASNYSASVLPNPYGLTRVAWQTTDKATVAGFAEPVDYNVWLLKHRPAPVPPTPDPSPTPAPGPKHAHPWWRIAHMRRVIAKLRARLAKRKARR